MTDVAPPGTSSLTPYSSLPSTTPVKSSNTKETGDEKFNLKELLENTEKTKSAAKKALTSKSKESDEGRHVLPTYSFPQGHLAPVIVTVLFTLWHHKACFGNMTYAARCKGDTVGTPSPHLSSIKPSARNTSLAYSHIFSW